MRACFDTELKLFYTFLEHVHTHMFDRHHRVHAHATQRYAQNGVLTEYNTMRAMTHGHLPNTSYASHTHALRLIARSAVPSARHHPIYAPSPSTRKDIANCPKGLWHASIELGWCNQLDIRIHSWCKCKQECSGFTQG